ncbi:MAG: heme exporter protein CcmB [Myxococcales bacterium]|nr:heme exporter protein CcmB [Myxococcales bacterium]
MTAARVVLLVLRKDLAVEWRSKELLATVVFLAITLMVVFSFSFPQNPRVLTHAVAGMVWAAVTFAATIALSRAFDRERQNDTLRALLLAPVSRTAIFVGKLLAMWLFLLGMAVVVCAAGALFMQLPWSWPLLLALTLGTLGLATVGVVVAGMLLRSAARDVLLPVVLYPLAIPLLLAASKVTSLSVLDAENLTAIRYWCGFLAAYDALFLVAALWMFEELVIE